MVQQLTVRQMLAEKGDGFGLRLIAGQEGLDRPITQPELNRPSLALAGFTEFFSWQRVQIIGVTETEYLNRTERRLRAQRIAQMFLFEMPCVILTGEAKPVPEMVLASDRHAIPLIVSSVQTLDLYRLMSPYLEMTFAPRIQIHGGLLEVYGMGVLLRGRSGVGKSECALELIERGHRLIADDVVVLRRLPLNRIVGMSSAVLRHHMEIRGLGIVDVESLFGIGSVRDLAEVDLVVRLEKWDKTKTYERIGADTPQVDVLGVHLPEYTLPIEPGRNISILVEVAALNQRLKNSGRNPADAFEQNLLERIKRGTRDLRPAPAPAPLPLHGGRDSTLHAAAIVEGEALPRADEPPAGGTLTPIPPGDDAPAAFRSPRAT